MRFVFAALILLSLGSAALAEPMACIPPLEPFVPADDAAFREFADLVAEDFERYFSEFGPYIACLDTARQEAFDQAHRISALHEAFWRRADQFGLTQEVAPDGDPP
jgi:hypothetical protein